MPVSESPGCCPWAPPPEERAELEAEPSFLGILILLLGELEDVLGSARVDAIPARGKGEHGCRSVSTGGERRSALGLAVEAVERIARTCKQQSEQLSCCKRFQE
jgi:hypothetical protein